MPPPRCDEIRRRNDRNGFHKPRLHGRHSLVEVEIQDLQRKEGTGLPNPLRFRKLRVFA